MGIVPAAESTATEDLEAKVEDAIKLDLDEGRSEVIELSYAGRASSLGPFAAAKPLRLMSSVPGTTTQAYSAPSRTSCTCSRIALCSDLATIMPRARAF